MDIFSEEERTKMIWWSGYIWSEFLIESDTVWKWLPGWKNIKEPNTIWSYIFWYFL